MVSGARTVLNRDCFGMQSEVTRFHLAMSADDHVKQDDAGLFTLDSIGRIDEWRAAMLANPSHG